jgi:maltose O-acetyltransferase
MSIPDRALSEREKMLAGQLYCASDPELAAALRRGRRLSRLNNQTTEEEGERRAEILAELFARIGAHADIQPPFFCDYGCHIEAGHHLFMNYNCVILDCNRVEIGDNVQMGPGVHIYTAHHPTDPAVRQTGLELATPVRIGSNVWIGGGSIICPGTTIGDNSVIGAGSIVTRDVPANVIAAGNPCRVVRSLAPEVV